MTENFVFLPQYFVSHPNFKKIKKKRAITVGNVERNLILKTKTMALIKIKLHIFCFKHYKTNHILASLLISFASIIVSVHNNDSGAHHLMGNATSPR